MTPPPPPKLSLVKRKSSTSGPPRPRCKVCQLPSDLLDRAHELRVEHSATLEDIASELTTNLKDRGSEVEINAQNLSTHYRDHGDATTRAAHAALRHVNNGRPALSPEENVFVVAAQTFADQGTSELSSGLRTIYASYSDQFARFTEMLDEYKELVNSILRAEVDEAERKLRESGHESTPETELKLKEERRQRLESMIAVMSTSVDTQVKLGREIRGTIDSLSKIGNPKATLDLFVRAILKRMLTDIIDIYATVAQGLYQAVELEAVDEDVSARTIELIQEHMLTFGPKVESAVSSYEIELDRLTASW